MLTPELKQWWLGGAAKKYANNPTSIIDPKTRVEMFKLVTELPVKKILEVGCNRAHNLVALSMLGDYELHGIDPSSYALEHANENCTAKLTEANAFDIPYPDDYFDLVFTCSVLMHIADRDMPVAVSEICRVSNRYVLAMEYWSELKDDSWSIETRFQGTLLLAFRSYRNIFPGYISHSVVPGNWGPEPNTRTLVRWLFELNKT